jgi:hypothetical protein
MTENYFSTMLVLRGQLSPPYGTSWSWLICVEQKSRRINVSLLARGSQVTYKWLEGVIRFDYCWTVDSCTSEIISVEHKISIMIASAWCMMHDARRTVTRIIAGHHSQWNYTIVDKMTRSMQSFNSQTCYIHPLQRGSQVTSLVARNVCIGSAVVTRGIRECSANVSRMLCKCFANVLQM